MFITCPSPHFETPTCPSTLEVLRAKEHIPTPFVVFTFGLTFESFKECGDESCMLFFTTLIFLVPCDGTLVRYRLHGVGSCATKFRA
jgi:hypothetical protein